MTNGKKVNNKYGTFKSVNLMLTMLMLQPLSEHSTYASNNREKVRQKLPRSRVLHSAQCTLCAPCVHFCDRPPSCAQLYKELDYARYIEKE